MNMSRQKCVLLIKMHLVLYLQLIMMKIQCDLSPLAELELLF